jgi:hypothetical protein
MIRTRSESFPDDPSHRKISICRLRVTLEHTVAFSGQADLPVYVRVP